jgi:hypothetical protein
MKQQEILGNSRVKASVATGLVSDSELIDQYPLPTARDLLLLYQNHAYERSR